MKQAIVTVQITEVEQSPITGKPVIKSVKALQFPPSNDLLYLCETYGTVIDQREAMNQVISTMRNMEL
jgi:hypothetical protein